MKGIFVSKPANIEELLERRQKNVLEEYKVIVTRKITETEWNDLTGSFLTNRDWLSEFSRQVREDENADWHARNCIRVSCEGQNFSLLIDTQGYDYARYVAILE